MVHLLAIDNHTDRRHYLGKTYSVHPSTTDIVILRVTLLNPSKHDDTLCVFSQTTYTRYIVSKGKVLAEYSGITGSSREFTFIYAGNQRIAMIDSDAKLHFYLNDHLGSARLVIDTAGTVKDNYDYYAFGEALDQTISTGQSYRYTGKPFDNDHSLSLNYYGARYCDPTTGRFISEDPLGFDGGDINFYVYVGNSPLSYIDPNGKGILPADPSGLGDQWVRVPEHIHEHGSKWRDPDGNTLEWNKAQPGMPGWRGKDHWHLNRDKKRKIGAEELPPGTEVPVDIETPAPQAEPGGENPPEEPEPGAVQRAMDWVHEHPTVAAVATVTVIVFVVWGTGGGGAVLIPIAAF